MIFTLLSASLHNSYCFAPLWHSDACIGYYSLPTVFEKIFPIIKYAISSSSISFFFFFNFTFQWQREFLYLVKKTSKEREYYVICIHNHRSKIHSSLNKAFSSILEKYTAISCNSVYMTIDLLLECYCRKTRCNTSAVGMLKGEFRGVHVVSTYTPKSRTSFTLRTSF